LRRKEFSITDRQEIEQFLSEMSFVFLGTINEDGFPDITPLNFVYYKGSIYIHGSKIGQKFKNISQHLNVTFAVASEYALLPSNFTDPNLACPASAFFKSVIVNYPH
jgi:nitroimidazol reductase NimA-like FMN-containing flavoprotein (pyridoxamine 5'-phosphate oxidase superfamily)